MLHSAVGKYVKYNVFAMVLLKIWVLGMWQCHGVTVFLIDPSTFDKGTVFLLNVKNHNPTMQCYIPEDLNLQCLTHFMCEMHHVIQF